MADKNINENIIENVPEDTSKDSTNDTTSNTSATTIDDSLTKLTSKLQTINTLREELIKLELNPEGRLYFNNDIVPLLTILYQLATTSVDLSTSANILSSSYLIKPNKSKLKDTFRLIYDMNEQCDDVYKLLEKKIEVLINIYCKS
ncbi:hypothetical protein [Clostridium lundense]|uniref:hypothetical protein n=1 Tax=Clostridium lundense TaxID=319475 RepID=UPI0004880850|nr:hypothetical protein [Clostridium lundense]